LQTLTVSGLPTNGTSVYATLYSLISGAWTANEYSYTALNAAADAAVVTSPANGSTLSGSSVTFSWTAGTSVSAFWLDVGSAADAHNYYMSGNLGTVQTITVNGLPINGSTVYVTLYSLIGGAWTANGYSYTALNGPAGLAVMLTPTPGSTLGQSATFTWSADASATAYWVDIGSFAGGHNVFSSGNLGNVLTLTVDPLPTNGNKIYVTLYSLAGDEWFNKMYTYTMATGFTLVQHVNNAACASSTTCAITLNQSIAAGDLLIFESAMGGTSLINGTDNGGTFVQCTSCVGFDNDFLFSETSGGWILSASAEPSPITVTFNAAAGGAIEMWEFSYTGGTVGFDGANQNETLGSSSPTAAAFTPTSGRYDISVQACSAGACNSVSSPFTGDNLGGNNAWAYVDNLPSWTAPTWTLGGSGASQLTQMEFGFGVEPCANTMFMDFGGTNGSAISVAQLASGTHGWQGGEWAIGGTGADLTFETAASQPLQNPTGRLCDGGFYTDSSATGLQYLTPATGTFLQINGESGMFTGTSVSAGVWYNSNLPAADTGGTDDFFIGGTGDADYAMLHESNTGSGRFGELNCASGTSISGGTGGSVTLARGLWYWVEIVYNETGNHTMKIYNNANPPVQQGSTMTCPSAGTTPPGFIRIGNGNFDTIDSGYVFWYDGLKISLDGTDPLLP
jgi:hypothetical protein